MDFISPGPAFALTTAHVSPDMLGPHTAAAALLDLGHDLYRPVSDAHVAIFLSLAERYGWDPTADCRSNEDYTLLEWLTLHPGGKPSLGSQRRWPTSLEAFWALDQDGDHPPVRNQDWLIALLALSGAPLWVNEHNGMGMPLVLYHCFLRERMRVLDLLMALPGAPAMETMVHLKWWATNGECHDEDPTFVGWLVKNRPNLLPHLTKTYPDVRLSAKQAAATPSNILEEMTPWLPADRDFRAAFLTALDERLYGGKSSTFDSYQWLEARRPLLETPPTPEEEQRWLRQAVVDEMLMFSNQKKKKSPWKMVLNHGSPGDFLLATGSTHARLKGDIPVLAALLLKSLLHSKNRERWDNYVGGDLEATVGDPATGTPKTLAGCLAPALNQLFGDGLPLRGLIALNLMEELDRYPYENGTRGCDTREAFLLGFPDTRGFVIKSLDEAMAVTLALIERFNMDEEKDAYEKVVDPLAKAWAMAMHRVRTSSTNAHKSFFLLKGRDDLQLALFRILRHWVGLWHQKHQSSLLNDRDPLQFLLDELMVLHRTLPPCPSFHDLKGDDQELLLLKCLVGRDPEKFTAVIRAIQENALSETNLTHFRNWLANEEHWHDEILSKGKGNYPLGPEDFRRGREALLHASLPTGEMNAKTARL